MHVPLFNIYKLPTPAYSLLVDDLDCKSLLILGVASRTLNRWLVQDLVWKAIARRYRLNKTCLTKFTPIPEAPDFIYSYHKCKYAFFKTMRQLVSGLEDGLVFDNPSLLIENENHKLWESHSILKIKTSKGIGLFHLTWKILEEDQNSASSLFINGPAILIEKAPKCMQSLLECGLGFDRDDHPSIFKALHRAIAWDELFLCYQPTTYRSKFDIFLNIFETFTERGVLITQDFFTDAVSGYYDAEAGIRICGNVCFIQHILKQFKKQNLEMISSSTAPRIASPRLQPYPIFIKLYSLYCMKIKEGRYGKNAIRSFEDLLYYLSRLTDVLVEQELFATTENLHSAIEKQSLFLIPILIKAQAPVTKTTLDIFEKTWPVERTTRHQEIIQEHREALIKQYEATNETSSLFPND